MTEVLPLAEVRSIATRYGYAEVQFKEKSRVVGFKSMSGDVRVNVYYTTGTVATCLSHPYKGKTQLFRRRQSLQSLEVILENPRAHTGEGYYQVVENRGGNRKWAPNNDTDKVQCDDALRWRYVQAATNFCKPQQASQIAALCELWNQIRFDPNGPTDLKAFDSLPEDVKDGLTSPCADGCGNCGSERAGTRCVLGSILVSVARITEGPEEVYLDFLFPSLQVMLNPSVPNEEKKPVPLEIFTDCQCDLGEQVQQSLGDLLRRFQRQLMSFPKPIRRELIYFFMKKLYHSYDLMMGMKQQSEVAPICQERKGENIYLGYYGGIYLSNQVLGAHYDYGELAYGDDKKGGRCNCHGINV